MLKNILFVVSALAIARAQIPNLGWCPDYVPKADFDMAKFMGVWYEAQRYFQLSEVVSRCVMANYTKGPDGKLRVSNEVTNRFTGIKRILEGEIKAAETKDDEGKLHVKYTTIPLAPETQYSVLDTDYENFAVLWSCSGIGPIHAQSAWLMTRSRRPSDDILQMAYGVLDKYKISKNFFVKTDQDDCVYLDATADTAKPGKKPDEKPTEAVTVEEAPEKAQAPKSAFNLRSAITPDAPAIIIETREAEIAAAEKAAASKEPEVQPEAESEVPIAEQVEALQEPEKELNTVEKVAEPEVAAPPASVPEVILKAAERAKEVVELTVPEVQNLQPNESINETSEKSAEQSEEELSKPAKELPAALQKPLQQLQDALQKPAAQFQEFIQHPVQQFQAALQGPIQQFQAAIQGPVDKFQAAFQHKPETPAAEKPAAEKPAAEKPAAEKPAAEKPAAEKPAAEKPAAEKPAAEKPAAEKPAAEKPAAEKPEVMLPPFEVREQALDTPAESAPEKLPEETLVASQEAPKEEENKNDAKKIES